MNQARSNKRGVDVSSTEAQVVYGEEEGTTYAGACSGALLNAREDLDAALAQVAALRERLEGLMVFEKAHTMEFADCPCAWCHARKTLSDTAAAAQEYEKRIRREARAEMRQRCALKIFSLLLNGPGSATADKHAAAIRALEVEDVDA